MAQRLLRKFVKFVLGLIANVEVEGIEHLPPSGGYILAANHLGRSDSALLYYFIDRDDLIMPVAEKYKDHWLYGPLVRSLGGFFINRYDADLKAIREVLKRLASGGVFVIAPEGTRSKTEKLQQGHSGIAYFANKSKLPVLPIAITGTEDRLMVENLKKFKKSSIKVRAGAPFYLTDFKASNSEALENAATEVMCRIAAMLPESYWGYYADNPRVRELAADA